MMKLTVTMIEPTGGGHDCRTTVAAGLPHLARARQAARRALDRFYSATACHITDERGTLLAAVVREEPE